ncbi:MAG: AI-2E family transporter [Alphaproteobacteria bacterium]
MALSAKQHLRFWMIALVVFMAAVWVLREVLPAFLCGMIVGYLLDPIALKLQKRGWARWAATSACIGGFFVTFLSFVLLLVPLVTSQLLALIRKLPGYIERLRDTIEPMAINIMGSLSEAQKANIESSLAQLSGQILEMSSNVAGRLVDGGVAVFDFISFMVIMPVVAFYMLRDWHTITDRLDNLLPRPSAPTIRMLAGRIDNSIAGFIRGQMTVCFVLGLTYAILLSLVGLEFGFVIGMMAGLLSFIPYVGSIFGFIASTGMALIQFGMEPMVLLVIVIFVAGQFLEGNVLTPKFVGDRIGLHAVWVIFALMAGGNLFGFVGLLLAVPVAAIIGVLVRFGLERYRASHYYDLGLGYDPENDEHIDADAKDVQDAASQTTQTPGPTAGQETG